MRSAVRFSSRVLTQAQELLLELHASHEPAELRARITAGIAKLIACDRASFNEADLSPAQRKIVPTPTPAWWRRLGEVYQQHMLDHPAWSLAHPPRLLQTMSLADPCYARAWKKSALCNEYFLPLDVAHQLSARIHEEGARRTVVSLNRDRRGFSPRERAIVDLLNPHFAQAWRNALLFTALRDRLDRSETDPDAPLAAIAVDARRGTIRALSGSASRLLRHYFMVDSAGGGRLPAELARWLRAQCVAPIPAAHPAAPLVIQHSASRLTVSLARLRPEEIVLLLRDCPGIPPGRKTTGGLSPREGEILDWIIEGKRNSEIAVILAISLRTVEKHVEHILLKLGAETRGAAVRQACGLLARRGV